MGETEINDFVEALCKYVADELAEQDGEYVSGSVKVVDARNHCFRTLPERRTDEAEDIYALSDLCHVDEESMRTLPDKNRAISVARNYF